MIVEMRLNRELMELIQMIAERTGVSVPEWIQDNLEKAAIEANMSAMYKLFAENSSHYA